ncbi:MAG: LicD family protein [Candidatus Helarchaeota archaeon]
MKKNINYFSNRTEKKKNDLIVGIKDIMNFFEKKLNIKVYLVYGTLLGSIRENDFINHDHDIDLAYLSNKHTVKEVIKETQHIYTTLKNYKMLGKLWASNGAIFANQFTGKEHPRGHAHIWDLNHAICTDLFTSWIDKKGKYHLVRKINGEFSNSILLPFLKGKLRGENFRIPNGSKRLLTYWYKNWEIPMEHNYLNCKKVCRL